MPARCGHVNRHRQKATPSRIGRFDSRLRFPSCFVRARLSDTRRAENAAVVKNRRIQIHLLILKSHLPRLKQRLIRRGAPVRAVHEVSVASHLISFQTWSRGGTEGGCAAGVLAEIGLPLPIIVNINPPDRQAGRREATREAARLLNTSIKAQTIFDLHVHTL